jgi:tRNA(fMet)-specific endonuclease VapC
MALLIESSVFITLERESRPWREIFSFSTSDEGLAIAAITASELLTGVFRADSDQRRNARQVRVSEIIENLTVLSFDISTARIHARLWAELEGRGERIGPYDMIIAATALAFDHSLLTDNVREFSRVPGLEVRQPAW